MAKAASKKPDPILVADQLKLLQSMYFDWGAEAFSRYMIWILGKRQDKRATVKTHSRLIPFSNNAIQSDMQLNIGQKNICLKPRQVGLTTWFLLNRLFVPSIIFPGTNSLLISQNGEYVARHFTMLRRAYKYIGAKNPGNPEENHLTNALQANLLHTSYSNRKELIFDQLDNNINIASAEVEETGQGITLHRVVGSEVSRWPGVPEETLANLKEAIVIEGTLDLEATANGIGGYFFEEYQRAERGESDFVAHFHPWWWQEEYKVELSTAEQEELAADLAEDERKLREKFHLTLEQIAFRRNKQKSLRHNFDEKYPEDAITAFLVQGSGFFDKDILRARTLELTDSKPVLSFAGGKAVIFQKRIKGRKYLIGADAASGKQIGAIDPVTGNPVLDSSTAKVIDLETGEEVAAYINQLPPEDFGLDLIDLGHYFNDALIAVERSTGAESGGDGGTIIKTLLDNNYPNVYYHKEMIKKKGVKKKVESASPGFPTTTGTRPIILNKLRFIIENYPELIHDKILLRQSSTFVRNEKGRPAATTGTHDDMVLASAIVHGVRAIELGLWDPLARRREKYGQTPQDEAEEEEIDE